MLALPPSGWCRKSTAFLSFPQRKSRFSSSGPVTFLRETPSHFLLCACVPASSVLSPLLHDIVLHAIWNLLISMANVETIHDFLLKVDIKLTFGPKVDIFLTSTLPALDRNWRSLYLCPRISPEDAVTWCYAVNAGSKVTDDSIQNYSPCPAG